MGILDAPSYTRTQIDTRVAAKLDRPKTVGVQGVGDSIEADVGGYLPILGALTGQRMRMDRIDGVGGQTTTQILARIPDAITSAQALGSAVVLMGGSTNDHNQGIAETVTRANFASARDLVRAAGLEFAVRNCPPVDVGAAGGGPWSTLSARRAQVQRHNAWIEAWAAANSIPFVDLYSASADPATGGYRAGYTSDSIHPNPVGALAAARQLLPILPPIFANAPRQRTARVKGTGENLLAAGLSIGDTNADGLADGWKGGGSFTTKTIDSSDLNIRGNWQNLAGSSVATIYDDTIVGTPGHIYEFAALAAVASGQLSLRMSFLNASFVKIGDNVFSAQNFPALVTKSERPTFRCQGVCPVGATKVQVEVVGTPVSGAVSISVAEVLVRDLTDLGIV